VSKDSRIALTIEGLIYQIRNERVLLDQDLAQLYGVETKALVQAVKRNKARFPQDFMFQLSDSFEVTNCDLKRPRWS